MTEKAKRQDREEQRDDRERLSDELSVEQPSERVAQDEPVEATTIVDAAVEPASESGQAVEKKSPRPRQRRAPRKTVSAHPAASEPEATDASVQERLALTALEADANELQTQGFTEEEAQRLIDISKRLETSAEARASQAELKRLRFAQWLVEHGILDEFSM